MTLSRAEVSELVHQYRRLSELLRRVYLDDSDEEIDVDDFGERYARRGVVIGELAKAGHKKIICWLSEEDHLYWRLAVLQRKLKERGATPAEFGGTIEVTNLWKRIDIANESVHNLVHSVAENPEP